MRVFLERRQRNKWTRANHNVWARVAARNSRVRVVNNVVNGADNVVNGADNVSHTTWERN